MLKKFTNKKGFTLMEMLIVVAIIAVLIAIAIPTFASQLNRSKASADAANIRAGYADLQLKILTETIGSDTTFYLQKDGSVKAATAAAGTDYKCAANKADNTSIEDIGGLTDVNWTKGNSVKYTVAGGKVTKIEPGT